MPTMEEIFSKMEEPEIDEDVEIFDEGHPRFEGRPSFEFNLPSMDRVFEEIGEVLPKMEQRMEPLMNRVMEIEIENPFEEFKETPRMSMMPRFPGNFLGHRDRDDDFDFGGLLDHLTNQVMSSQVIPTSPSHISHCSGSFLKRCLPCRAQAFLSSASLQLENNCETNIY